MEIVQPKSAAEIEDYFKSEDVETIDTTKWVRKVDDDGKTVREREVVRKRKFMPFEGVNRATRRLLGGKTSRKSIAAIPSSGWGWFAPFMERSEKKERKNEG